MRVGYSCSYVRRLHHCVFAFFWLHYLCLWGKALIIRGRIRNVIMIIVVLHPKSVQLSWVLEQY
ncbi:hypothetical protein BDV19DRAFT_368865 [Aspergillus venezuelensis]